MAMLKEVACFMLILGIVAGHGYLWEPPGRGTARLRGYKAFPFNFDHMSNYCGGYQVQWEQNGGLCGVCGDGYNEQFPRRHEVGGAYGPVNRPVTGTYQSGSVMVVGIQLTAYHRGFFTFRLCVNNDFSTEVRQECLNENLLIVSGTGSPYYQINTAPNKIGTGPGYYTIPLQLPAGVVATQAVLQWNYTVGNSWRNWPSQSGCFGCGPQETFINCADIAIEDSGETTTTSTTSTSPTFPATTTSTSTTSSTATTSTSTIFPAATSALTISPTTATSSSTTSPSTTNGFPTSSTDSIYSTSTTHSPTTVSSATSSPFTASPTTSSSTSSPTATTSSSPSSPTTASTATSSSTSSPTAIITTAISSISSQSTNSTGTINPTTSAIPTPSLSKITSESMPTISSITSAMSTTTSPTTSIISSTVSSTTTTSALTSTTSLTQGCTNTCSDNRNACSCTGAGAYSFIAALANWCLANCAVGFCPASHCQCFCY